MMTFKQLRIRKIDPQTIYRLDYELIEGPYGPDGVVTTIKEIHSNFIPNDDFQYLIWVEVDNNKTILAYCNPAIQFISDPYFNINPKGRLVRLTEAEENDISKIQPLIHFEDHDESLQIKSESMPDKVKWEDFIPEYILQDVAYSFIAVAPGQFFIEDLNFEQLNHYLNELEKSLREWNLTPKMILNKVFIKKLPNKGGFWYIPVQIKFNKKQNVKGYALFNGWDGTVKDIHVFDARYGLISTTTDIQKLEDCGIFKDERTFSYEFLLSKLNEKENK